MRNQKTAVLLAVASGLLSVLLAVAVNVATGGLLPGPLVPYAGLAWPAVGLLAAVVIVLAIVQSRDGSDPRRTGAMPQPAVKAPVPVTTPHDTVLVGRDDDIAAIDRAFAGGTHVVVIAAAPGTGKSVLAAHYAHRVAVDFPDGVLYAELRGGSAEPADARPVLDAFLEHLRVPADERRRAVGDLAARFRTEVAGRRMLVLLDNAHDAAQVLPLLPGGPECRTVVTARRALPRIPGALTVLLGPLTDEHAVQLFRAKVGAERVAADPDGVRRVVAACGGLPLALNIAAHRLRTRPQWSFSALAQLLESTHGRLAAFSVDGASAVRASFASGYESLPELDRMVFRRAGSHPGQRFTLGAAAARCGLAETVTEQALDRLAELFLVEVPEPGRYRLHDLLRLFADDLLESGERVDCLHRLLQWQIRTAAPGEWLAEERQNVLDLLSAATGPGPHRDAAAAEAAWKLVEAVHPLLTAVDEHVDRLRLWQLADDAAVILEDGRRRSRALRWVSHARTTHGEATVALDAARQAVAYAEASGDDWEIAQSIRRYGEALRQLNQFDEAEAALRQALDLFVASGHVPEEIEVLSALGTLYNNFWLPEKSLPVLERAAALLPEQQASIHGWVFLALGLSIKFAGRDDRSRSAEARHFIDRAFAVAQHLGDDYLLGYCHLERAWHAEEEGSLAAAIDDFHAGRVIFERISDGAGVGGAYEGLGAVTGKLGRHGDAADLFAVAVAQFARLGNPSREGECRVQRAAQLQESGDTMAADAERAAAQRILDDGSVRYGPQVFALLPQVDDHGRQDPDHAP
jgi:tetratricopeptide (TPR) repeat protein